MRVLGFDPGVKNLGLSVVEWGEEPGPPQVIWSQNMCVGEMDASSSYSRSLIPYLENLWSELHFEAVGGEEPPIIMERPKTTARISLVCGILFGWAEGKDLRVRTKAPTTLKAEARRVTGRPADDSSKSLVKEALERILGAKGRRTSHENDAAFAALVCWMPPAELKATYG